MMTMTYFHGRVGVCLSFTSACDHTCVRACVCVCVCMSLPHDDIGWSMVVAIPVILTSYCSKDKT